MILKRGAVVGTVLKWQKDEFNRVSLNFRNIIFMVVPVSERAYGVEIFFPYVRVEGAGAYDENPGENINRLAYDRDFAEGYESIESAEYAVETWLSNVLHFDFTDDEKDNERGSD